MTWPDWTDADRPEAQSKSLQLWTTTYQNARWRIEVWKFSPALVVVYLEQQIMISGGIFSATWDGVARKEVDPNDDVAMAAAVDEFKTRLPAYEVEVLL